LFWFEFGLAALEVIISEVRITSVVEDMFVQEGKKREDETGVMVLAYCCRSGQGRGRDEMR